jgi:hypothetical protein
MRVLRTKMSFSRMTKQYEEAVKLNIDAGEVDKFEYKFEPFNLVLDKVAGYSPEPERAALVGEQCTRIFIDSDYIIIGISVEKFEAIMRDFPKSVTGFDIIEKIPKK